MTTTENTVPRCTEHGCAEPAPGMMQLCERHAREYDRGTLQTESVTTRQYAPIFGGSICVIVNTLDEARTYIDQGVKAGNDRADYGIVTRTVTYSPWDDVPR